MEIVGNYVNIDWLEFCAGECKEDVKGDSVPQKNGESISLSMFKMGSENNDYNVFSLNGTFLGRIQAVNSRDLLSQVQVLTQKRGIYYVKSVKNGFVQKIAVTGKI